MATLFGKPIQALTYGVLRQNVPVVDAAVASGQDPLQAITNAIAFLRLAFPDATDADFDMLTPGAILVASAALYMATFTRPEEPAPAPQNP